MDELDARLRAMAKREDWALPAAYETAMDGLEEQIRQGTLDRPGKRRLGKRVLFLAAALAVLACGFAVAAATTPPSPTMWSPPPEQIPILPSPRPWPR